MVASATRSQKIDRNKLRMDGGTQSRAKIDHELAKDYAVAIHNGAEFPPVDVFYDGKEYWLADGFHRVLAYETADVETIPAIIHQGDQRAAILFSVGANGRHGLRRTNEDKRRAVETLLRDGEWVKWNDKKIATTCGVSGNFVGDVRRSIINPINDGNMRLVERNGTVYEQDTANIGKTPVRELVSVLAEAAREQAADLVPGEEVKTARELYAEASPSERATMDRERQQQERRRTVFQSAIPAPPPDRATAPIHVSFPNNPIDAAAVLAGRLPAEFILKMIAELQNIIQGANT